MRSTTEISAEIEHAVLTTDAGLALLDAISRIDRPGPRDLARWRKLAPADFVSAAVRLSEGRRRGAAKFTLADRMWFDPIAFEQATSEPVARHKARRFAGSDAIDLCCGIGGDAVAIAMTAGRVMAVDGDRGMVRRTIWNAGIYGVRERVLGVQGRAERLGIGTGTLVHIDPDRRAGGGKRSKAIAGYAPGLEWLRALPARCRGGAIKLGPASDFEDHFGGPAWEIEVVSLGGECKEATAWFGDLAGCRRRATVLPSGSTWTDAEATGTPRFDAIGEWLFDPDPALTRSGLLDGFAAAHDLSRFAAGVDLLTGPRAIRSPFLATFAVEDVLPLDPKHLRRAVRDRGLGTLEIKVRGLDLRPEDVRRQLEPDGPNTGTLILVGGGDRGRAIVARRMQAD